MMMLEEVVGFLRFFVTLALLVAGRLLDGFLLGRITLDRLLHIGRRGLAGRQVDRA